jgi:N6-adenosine-specific RNA methylase IME4
VVIADPPWNFKTYSDKGHGKSPQKHYACLSLDDIKALPVETIAAEDSYLFLWATAPMLPQALAVMDAWCFDYKTTIAWIKTTASGKPRMGCGFIARTMHENVLIGTRGRPGQGAIALPSLIQWYRAREWTEADRVLLSCGAVQTERAARRFVRPTVSRRMGNMGR